MSRASNAPVIDLSENATVPDAVLHAANITPEMKGRVKPEAARTAMMVDGVVAGFCTPHETKMGLRLGPLYVAPDYRRMGLAALAWDRFRDRVCVAFVNNANTASAALHAKLASSGGDAGARGGSCAGCHRRRHRLRDVTSVWHASRNVGDA